MKFKWELIESPEIGDYTERAKVIGGWVIRSFFGIPCKTVSMVFIPDPNHEWNVK